MMLIKLAWRNIWRNRRRTFITVASILFAVLFSSVLESLQKGGWNNMINNVVNFYFGYGQIHQKGYWEEKDMDLALAIDDSINSISESIPQLDQIVPRMEGFALASTGDNTFGVMVVGVDPEKEDRLTALSERLVDGQFLGANDAGALLASGVAERLELQIGDTILLLSQGYRGVNAAGKFPVRGILKFPSPDLDDQLLYLSLSEAQYFYGAMGMATSLVIDVADQDALYQVVHTLNSQLDTSYYAVLDWKKMMPELIEAQALDSAGNLIVYLLLYVIIAFGIFGTILMMTKERKYEFGILTAIGMRRSRLGFVIWLETVLLGILGALGGIMVSIPVVLYLKHSPLTFTGDYAVLLEKFGFEPIFPTLWDPTIFVTQAFLVFGVTAILGLFPVWKIRRLQPVKAMRS